MANFVQNAMTVVGGSDGVSASKAIDRVIPLMVSSLKKKAHF